MNAVDALGSKPGAGARQLTSDPARAAHYTFDLDRILIINLCSVYRVLCKGLFLTHLLKNYEI